MFDCFVAFCLPFKTSFPSFHVDSVPIAIMLSPPIPRVFGITAFVLLALLWRISAQDVNTVFKVASGNEPGSCDQYLGSLNAQFTEALAIGAAGFAAIQKVRAKIVSYPERLILYSMFGLNVGNYVSGGEWEPGDDTRIGYIRGTTPGYFP